MSIWQKLSIEDKLRAILNAAIPAAGQEHLGRPFLTAYQIALELNARHPQIAQALNVPVGGEGIGQHSSLAQYLAGQLSKRISNGTISGIEGALLSNQHLQDIFFKAGPEEIRSSLTKSNYMLSMFRLTSLP